MKLKLYGSAVVGERGQVVIPAKARQELNINPGDQIFVIGKMGGLVLLPENLSEDFLCQVANHITSGMNKKNKQ